MAISCLKCGVTTGLSPLSIAGSDHNMELRLGSSAELVCVSIGYSCGICWQSYFSRTEELEKLYREIIDMGTHPKIAIQRVAVLADKKEDMTITKTICRLINTDMHVSALRNMTPERRKDISIAEPVARSFLEVGQPNEAAKILKGHPDSALWQTINTQNKKDIIDLEEFVESLDDVFVDRLYQAWQGISARFKTLVAPKVCFSAQGSYLCWRTPTTILCLGFNDFTGDTYLMGKDGSEHVADTCRNFEFGEASLAWFYRIMYS